MRAYSTELAPSSRPRQPNEFLSGGSGPSYARLRRRAYDVVSDELLAGLAAVEARSRIVEDSTQRATQAGDGNGDHYCDQRDQQTILDGRRAVVTSRAEGTQPCSELCHEFLPCWTGCRPQPVGELLRRTGATLPYRVGGCSRVSDTPSFRTDHTRRPTTVVCADAGMSLPASHPAVCLEASTLAADECRHNSKLDVVDGRFPVLDVPQSVL
jgi:hypothetical protein